MIIRFDRALPCALYRHEAARAGERTLCEQPATAGILVPMGEGLWKLLPLCPEHLHETIAEES
jgi:hypothetical protein